LAALRFQIPPKKMAIRRSKALLVCRGPTVNLQTLRGLADYWRQNTWVFSPWGFAMNGQTSRLEVTRQLLFTLNIERIIETGTYRGTTTEWFAQFGLPVETVELNERFFAFSRARLSRFENVTVIRRSSVPFLKEKLADAKSLSVPTLFYLDSHWNDHLPLREELELIFNNYSDATVLIDDFKVPDDDGYGFDDYGKGKALTLDYVSQASTPKLFCFFPRTPSNQETGFRRGWVVMTTNSKVAASLRTRSLLRETCSIDGSVHVDGET
jgi:hypothetical protein